MQVLHRLGEHVRGRMPQDREPGRRLMPIGSTASPSDSRCARSRAEPVDLRRDNFAVGAGLAAERIASRRAGFHHVLASGESDMKLVGRHG